MARRDGEGMELSHDAIAAALRELRVQQVATEYDLHLTIALLFSAKGICYLREYQLGPRNRIDFMAGGVGIEVKKGKVLSSRMQAQAARYLAFDALDSLIIVVERCVFQMPDEINGKRVTVVALNKQWGIAL